jgi:hypothetical protein
MEVIGNRRRRMAVQLPEQIDDAAEITPGEPA